MENLDLQSLTKYIKPELVQQLINLYEFKVNADMRKLVTIPALVQELALNTFKDHEYIDGIIFLKSVKTDIDTKIRILTIEKGAALCELKTTKEDITDKDKLDKKETIGFFYKEQEMLLKNVKSVLNLFYEVLELKHKQICSINVNIKKILDMFKMGAVSENNLSEIAETFSIKE